MQILILKPKHIGDSLILSPTLRGLRRNYPDCEIDLILRQGCDGILEGCPEIRRIYTIAPVEKAQRQPRSGFRDFCQLLAARKTRYDYLFELGDGHRARWLAMLLRSKQKFSVKPASPLGKLERKCFSGVSTLDWEHLHRVEKDYLSVSEFMRLPEEIPPLVFDQAFTEPWPPAEGCSRYAVFQVGSRQHFNRWPAEKWDRLIRSQLPHFSKIILATGPAPEEVELAERLKALAPENLIATRGRTSWPQIAGLLHRADLLVTLNTAVMHLGAACQCPSVCLFGPSLEEHWHPWKAPHEVVRPRNSGPGDSFAVKKLRKMEDIQVEDVVSACQRMRRNWTGE